MLNSAIRPSTLDGIKRLAKLIKRTKNCNHATALNFAAQQAGFSNFKHAQKSIKPSIKTFPSVQHFVFISMSWWDRKTNSSGFEVLEVPLSKPLHQLISPTHLKIQRHLHVFQMNEADHIHGIRSVSSQSVAIDYICAAARTFQFINATELKPSRSHSRVYPKGSSKNQIPGQDHSSVWYHPSTRSHILIDEPYRPAIESRLNDRAEWASSYDYLVVKPNWSGMYNPDGESDMYLIADRTKTNLISKLIDAINLLDSPYSPNNWQGISLASGDFFESPAKKLRLLNVVHEESKIKQNTSSKLKQVVTSKMNPYRKLFVLALNHLLENKIFDLDWNVSSSHDNGFAEANIAGKYTVINWHDHGHGEVYLTVWWNYDISKDPRSKERNEFQYPPAHKSRYSEFVSIVASIYLERKDGKWLQGRGSDYINKTYTRKGDLEILKAIPDPTPNGFLAEGKFYF